MVFFKKCSKVKMLREFCLRSIIDIFKGMTHCDSCGSTIDDNVFFVIEIVEGMKKETDFQSEKDVQELFKICLLIGEKRRDLIGFGFLVLARSFLSPQL